NRRAMRSDAEGGDIRVAASASQEAFVESHAMSSPTIAADPSAAGSAQREMLAGLLLATFGAIAFSGKAIIVKLAYRYGVDAVTLIMYRMLFALPLFLAMSWWAGRDRAPLTGADLGLLVGLGCSGSYLPSFLDVGGLPSSGA